MTVNLNTIQLKSGSNEPPNGFLAINELGYSINQNQLYIGKKEGENIISIPIGVSGLTANRVLISNTGGEVAVSTITSTQLDYLSEVTSSIQTQLNSKAIPYVAGTNIVIDGTTINATDTTYTAGTNMSLSGTVFSATDTKYTSLPANGGNSATVGTYAPSTIADSANTIPVRTSSGYLYLGWINTPSGDVGNVQPYYVYCNNTTSDDTFIRKIPFTNLADRINGYGSAKNSHTHAYAASSHNHSAANITSGTLALARIPVQKGSTTINSTDKTITFPTAFAGVPSITMTYATTDVNAAGDHGCIKIHHLTKSNFQVTNSGTTTYRAVNWIAVY